MAQIKTAAGKISGPIRRLAAHAELIGRGKLDEEFSVERGDEVGDLARVLNKMTVDLQHYIEDLRRTTAAKERMEGELAATMQKHLPRIGHIQLADNPGRNEPGTGEINYAFLFQHLDRIGYTGHIGCEYKPKTTTTAGLGWLASL